MYECLRVNSEARAVSENLKVLSKVVCCCFCVIFVANMSSDCANCDCADKTQCPKKKGFQMDGIVETSYEMGHAADVSLENDCKCGPNCQCGTCSCHT